MSPKCGVSMITAVDTNILVDVFREDPLYYTTSAQALRQCMKEGIVVACDIVWAELAALFNDTEKFNTALQTLGIDYSPIEPASAEQSGILWATYRKNKGSRMRVIADFMIAAHALVQCDRLLSRDRGFYRTYFKNLTLIDPQALHRSC